MARIPDEWLDAVVFMYASRTAAQESQPHGATGFIVQVPALQDPTPSRGFHYLVTNSHVAVHGPVLRLNHRDKPGFDVIEMSPESWTHHSAGDDVAIAPVPFDMSRYAVAGCDLDLLLTDEDQSKYGFGEGDQCFFIGRHISLDGRERNTPSVRFGAISMMGPEPVLQQARGHHQESVVVEARSLGGYSGSPVFVYASPYIRKDDELGLSTVTLRGAPIRLLGIDWGHMRARTPVMGPGLSQSKEDRDLALNSGMMLVVPARKIRELINDPVHVEARRLAELREAAATG